MALVAFLRGINVGGHRRFRPSILAKELNDYDVVNIGAAGTFIVRSPGSQTKFRAELLRRLPFDAEVMLCNGRDLIRAHNEHPYGEDATGPDVVRFVSVLAKSGRVPAALPVSLPPNGDWLVKVIAVRNQFVFGMYRRHMKTIGYLGRLDQLFGVPATTRNWTTVQAIVRALTDHRTKGG